MIMEGDTDVQESCFKLKAADAEVGVPQPESGSVPGAKPTRVWALVVTEGWRGGSHTRQGQEKKDGTAAQRRGRRKEP